MTQQAVSAPGRAPATLVKGLGTFDGVLITIGSILGTGVFITTSDIARVLPHPGLILVVWVFGGAMTLAGALSYAELGVLFPRAGGQYQFLREAYGPKTAFLFGWTAFAVVNSGGIAALAVGFGEYLGAFLPFFSTGHVIARMGGWTLSGGQVAGAGAILFLSAVNYVGLREGTWLQNVVTIVKVGSILALVLLGLVLEPAVASFGGAAPKGAVSGFLVAMIAVLWCFDGWYGVTASAGEMRDPRRSLPRALVGGTFIVTALYTAVNFVYLQTLPLHAIQQTGRIGETAAGALLGPGGARLVALAVLVSTFGCISSTILWASRIYLAMAEDGLFFSSLAIVHPRHRTPGASIVAQGLWAVLLTVSGTYEQLYTYAMFAATAFHALTGLAVIVLRRTRPGAARAYRTWGYPWTPLAFVAACGAIVLNTAWERPVESAVGIGLVALGIPAYARWRRLGARQAAGAGDGV